MPRFRIAAVAAMAITLLLAPTAAYAHPGDHDLATERATSRNWLAFDRSSGPLQDLQLGIGNAFDHASASVVMVGVRSSMFHLQVRDVHTAATGQRFGAHLHTGPCVAGDDVGVGGHYNVQKMAGVAVPDINENTEVWLDFTVRHGGTARSTATVPFVPTDGTRSIVIHASPTMDNGSAGLKVACLPFEIG